MAKKIKPNLNWKKISGFTKGEKLYYKDHTFCNFYEFCQHGNNCKSALTKNILDDAAHFKLPVKQYTKAPDHCYVELK